MNKTSKPKFTYIDRKQIVEKIEKLNNDEDYLAIFDILAEDESSSFHSNSNGVFLNLSSLKDETLENVSNYLKKIAKKNSKKEINDDIIPVTATATVDRQYKLSNFEKNIIKQRDLKKSADEKNKIDAKIKTRKLK